MLAAFDFIFLVYLEHSNEFISGDLKGVLNLRTVTTLVAPVIVMLFVNVIPQHLKFSLVYFRRPGWMPGCDAFSVYGPRDPRVDMQALAKNVGELPSGPKAANARWYQLYRLVQNDPGIVEVHRTFLMYRDMAGLSFLFAFIAPTYFLLLGSSVRTAVTAALVFAIQYGVTALSANSTGIRFVVNVLALHSVKAVAGAKTKAAAAKAN